MEIPDKIAELKGGYRYHSKESLKSKSPLQYQS